MKSDRTIDALVACRAAHPQQRAGQIIENALALHGHADLCNDAGVQIFYLDDDLLAAALEAFSAQS